jgi:hypothetical protein
MALVGYLESVDPRFVRGWAYDTEMPAAHLEVVVRIGEEFCASSHADVARNDLLQAGIGDGSHGFSIDLAESDLSAADAAQLRVHVISGAESMELFRLADKSDVVEDLVSEPSQPVSDEHQYPVFILGPARSGTSVMTLGLLDSARYVGMGEGHLMPLAHLLSSTVENYYRRDGVTAGTLLGRVPAEAFQRFLRRAFVQLARSLFQTVYWLDKTPSVEMVQAAPIMRELWPNAKFVFMKRRVIENVISRRRKFSADLTREHFLDWAAVMSAWLQVRDSLAGSAIEIEHRQLVLDPDGTIASIAAFLEMPAESAERLRRFVNDQQPERTDTNFGATYQLSDLGLDELEEQQMITACGPLMAAYGYSFDRGYYST